MRCLLLGVTLSLALGASPARAAGDDVLFSALDAVGVLGGHDYDPRPAIDAVNALQPLGKERGLNVLRRYLAARPAADERGGLFVVIRTLLEPPPASRPRPADACTPSQQEVAAGGCWRPPRLGAPVPPPPADLSSIRYPAFILGDVPLSVVDGYSLGGLPERLTDHLEALALRGVWRAAPLAPRSAGEIRYLFMHFGLWSRTDAVGRMVEAQLQRLESGPPPR